MKCNLLFSTFISEENKTKCIELLKKNAFQVCTHEFKNVFKVYANASINKVFRIYEKRSK